MNHNRLSLLNVFNLFAIHKPLLVKILCFPGIENTVHTHTQMTDITLIPQEHQINTCIHKVTSVSGIILRQLRPQRPWLPSCRGSNSYPHVCLQTQAWRTAQQKLHLWTGWMVMSDLHQLRCSEVSGIHPVRCSGVSALHGHPVRCSEVVT